MARKRRRMGRGESSRSFRRGTKVNSRNKIGAPMRGGIRL